MSEKEKTVGKKKYERHRRLGKCGKCGVEPSRPGMATCQKCAESERKDYDKYKSLGICPTCGHRDANWGRVRCFECAEKINELCAARYRNLTHEQKKRELKAISDNFKRRYQQRKADGICVKCGKRKPQRGVLRCFDCTAAAKRAQNVKSKDKIPRSLRIGLGLCYVCGGKAVDGGKLCDKCLAVAQEKAKKMREAPRSGNHAWIDDNRIALDKDMARKKRGGGQT